LSLHALGSPARTHAHTHTQGGGMRGVISGAMLMGLRALGLHNTVDAVYGASAGAINATYFLTNQPYGLDIYAGAWIDVGAVDAREDLVDGCSLDPSALRLQSARRVRSFCFRPHFHPARPCAEDLVDGRFLDPCAMFLPSSLRALVSSSPDRPAMDLDFLLGHVMQSVKPLDLRAVIDSPVPLKVREGAARRAPLPSPPQRPLLKPPSGYR
jgi:hypothetical protein